MLPARVFVTVEEVWHLALPIGTRLVAGKSGLERPIEWAVSLRATYPLFGALKKGYMALARLDLARRLDPLLTAEYLLVELARAEASSLVVDRAISSAEAALADRLALPVLLLPAEIDFHLLERDVLRVLVDREGLFALRQKEMRQRLQQLFASGGMQSVLEELARRVSGQVVLVSGHGIVIGQAGAEPRSHDLAENTFPIHMRGRLLGELVLRGSSIPEGSAMAVFAQQAAEQCGIEMIERLARQEAEERLGTDLVGQLLDASRRQSDIVSRFEHLGYDVSPGQRHLVIALSKASGGQDGGSGQGVLRYLEWAAQREGAHTLVVPYGEHVFCFCAIAPSASDSWLERAIKEAVASQPGQRCRVGVSRIVEGIPGLRRGVGQAIDAWNVGEHVDGKRSPFFYGDLGLYRFLVSLGAREELERFCDEVLGQLVQYDAAHNTELVHTLEVFFAKNANVSEAARALHAHRNTLNYRLQRIVDICGLDLNDAEARLALQLALKIHHLS